jgi:hypothetical protein
MLQRLGFVALAIGAVLSTPALPADGTDAQIVSPGQIDGPLPLVLRGGGADQSVGASARTATRGAQPIPGQSPPPPRSRNQGSAGRRGGPLYPDSGFNSEYNTNGLNYSR